MPPTSVAEMLYSTAESMDSAVSSTTLITAMMVGEGCHLTQRGHLLQFEAPAFRSRQGAQEAVDLVEDAGQVQNRPQHDCGHDGHDAQGHREQEGHLQDGPGLHLADQQPGAAHLGLGCRLDQAGRVLAGTLSGGRRTVRPPAAGRVPADAAAAPAAPAGNARALLGT